MLKESALYVSGSVAVLMVAFILKYSLEVWCIYWLYPCVCLRWPLWWHWPESRNWWLYFPFPPGRRPWASLKAAGDRALWGWSEIGWFGLRDGSFVWQRSEMCQCWMGFPARPVGEEPASALVRWHQGDICRAGTPFKKTHNPLIFF